MRSKKRKAICLNCKFNDGKDVVAGGITEVDYRLCQRYPPPFPKVKVWSWCGEHAMFDEEDE